MSTRSRTTESRRGEYEGAKKWKAANLTKVRGYSKSAYHRRVAADPRYLILHTAKARAKKLGVPFNLTIDDIVVPEFCPVLGIRLVRGVGKSTESSPSIDRMKPELGYVVGNIAVISMKANTIKSNATIAELRAVADWIEKQPRGTPCSPNLCGDCGANLNYGDCSCMTTFGELYNGQKKETLVRDGHGDGPRNRKIEGVKRILGSGKDGGVDFLQHKVLDEHGHGVAVVDCDGRVDSPRAVQSVDQHTHRGAK